MQLARISLSVDYEIITIHVFFFLHFVDIGNGITLISDTTLLALLVEVYFVVVLRDQKICYGSVLMS